jgi:GNAT superfamily N-acetyltransferase
MLRFTVVCSEKSGEIIYKKEKKLEVSNRVTIYRVLDLLKEIDILIDFSEQEGFRFLKRLKQEFISKDNCFNKEGEGLFFAYMNNELVAVGGLNQDPYNHSTMIGRLRRFYVHPNFRKYGIGSHLLKEIENFAQKYFLELHLYTDTDDAAQFYLKNGYEYVALYKSNFRKIIN